MLRVISSSPGDLKPVFNAVLENAIHLCEAKFGVLYRYDGNLFHPEALAYIARSFTGCLRLFRSDCSAARFGKFDGVAGSGALEAEWCANGLYFAFRTQNWYMPAKVDGFSISKSCQRARLVIVLSVGKRPRKFCSTLPGKWNPRKSS